MTKQKALLLLAVLSLLIGLITIRKGQHPLSSSANLQAGNTSHATYANASNDSKPTSASSVPSGQLKVSLPERQVKEIQKYLADYEVLISKKSRTRAEELELRTQLSTSRRVEQVYLLLKSASGDQYKTVATNYLISGIAFEKNPIRESYANFLKYLLVSEGLAIKASELDASAVTPEQIKMFRALRKNSPEEALHLAELSAGTRLAKIIALTNQSKSNQKI